MNNMKKIVTLLMVSLFVCNVGLSQYEKIDWGKLQTSAKKSYYPEIIGEDDDNIYVTADIGKEDVIEVYSKKDFTLKLEKTITPSKNQQK